jgi:hypothetical protein
VDLNEVRCNEMDWIEVSWDRPPMADLCEYGNKPLGCIKVDNILIS